MRFVFGHKKDLDENESIKVKFIKYAIVFALHNFLHRLHKLLKKQ